MAPTLISKIKTNIELSHFNSFYEIPKILFRNVPTYIKEGNIILNSSAQGLFILSPDLSKIIHYTNFKQSQHHRTHDVQVTERGTYLFFNNLVENGRKSINYISGPDSSDYHSAIQEINSRTHEVVAEFSARPKSIFYSWICGSIQEVDEDTWLFTHFLTGTYIYSKKKDEFMMSIPGTHADNERFVPVQQVKLQDLNSFLSQRN